MHVLSEFLLPFGEFATASVIRAEQGGCAINYKNCISTYCACVQSTHGEMCSHCSKTLFLLSRKYHNYLLNGTTISPDPHSHSRMSFSRGIIVMIHRREDVTTFAVCCFDTYSAPVFCHERRSLHKQLHLMVRVICTCIRDIIQHVVAWFKTKMRRYD